MFNPQNNRKIPAVMATQHPDNASAPFFQADPFISDANEMDEVFHNFSFLGNDEYMWDWEGKFADEAMLEKLMAKHHEFFTQHQIGKDVFITLRVPNIWEEKTFKLSRAYMSVLSAAEFTRSLNLATPPVFEFILPMTKRADQLIYLQKTFQRTTDFKEKIFEEENLGEGFIHIIPLFESVDDLTHSGALLEEYFDLFQAHFGRKPNHLRTFIARSDPSLDAGFLPSNLACRMALREFHRIEEKHGIPLYPIIGTGSLPFRGGVTPENIDEVLEQYPGVRTVTIQSAFRYDYAPEMAKKAVERLKESLPLQPPVVFADDEFEALKAINTLVTTPYRHSIEQLAPLINAFADHIPGRRARMQHIGLFGYNRGVGEVKLPRAIKFTGALYTMGLPPEFIGTGRGLRELKKRGELDLVERHFPLMKRWLTRAGRYINFQNLAHLTQEYPAMKEVSEDIELAAEVLNLEIGPKTDEEFLHASLTSTVLLKRKMGLDFSAEVVEAGKIRKSLG